MNRRPGRRAVRFAASPLWTPKAISGLVLWLRGDMGITLNGSNVSGWADQSGAGNNFAQAVGANQPPFNASSANLNSRQSVGPFNGGGNSGLLYSGANTYATPHQIFIVTYASSIVAGNKYVWGEGGQQADMYLSSAAGSYRFVNNLTDFAVLGAGAGKHILSAVAASNGGTMSVYDNAITPVNSGVQGATASTMLSASRSIGTYNNDMTGTFNFNGEVAEIIGFSSPLSTSDRTTLMLYLGVRYGQSIGA